MNGENRLQAYQTHISGMSVNTRKAAVEIAKLKAQYDAGALSEKAFNTELNAIITDTERMTFAQRGLTAATKALSVASKVLLNVGVMILVSAAVNLIVEKFAAWINKSTEIKQKTEELTSTIKNLKNETKTLSEHSDTLVDKYAKLSRGVNDLGENVSLTNEEYDEYKELVNQIADDVPNLITGYDNEGNAILKFRDNVDLLKQSYIEARKEKYKLAIADTADNAVENFNKTNALNNGIYGAGGLVTSGNIKLVAGENISYGEIRETFDYVLKHTYDEFIAALKNGEISLLGASYIKQMYDLGLTSTSEQFDEAIEKIRTDSITIQTEYKKAFDGIKSVAEAYLYSNDNYDALTEQMQNFASVLVNTIPEDIAKTWESEYDINDFITNLISLLQNATPEVQDALSKLLSFEIKDDSISNSKDEVDKYISILANYLNLDENYLKIQLGVSDVDDLADQLDHVINKAKDKFNLELDWQPTIEEDFSINTEEEIKLFAECVDACDSMTAALDLYAEKVKELPELTETFDYATYSEQVDNVIKNTNTLKKAIDTITESGSLEADTIAELAKTFPAYSAQILAAQGNSEQLKNVLITAMNAEPSSLIKTLEGLKGLTAEEQQEVDGLINILETLSKTTTNTAVSFKDWSEILKDVSDKESLLDSIHKELDKDGHISISTYQKLIEAGSDYADLVTIENGQLKISEQAFKDLVVQKYKDQVATIELAKAEKIRELAVKSSIGATQEEIQAIRDEITALAQASEAAKGNVDKALELWNNYDPDDGSGNGSSKTKSQYSNELQLLKDQLNDRIITYEQFLQRWQALNDKYRNMSEEDGGISDYEWGQNNRDIIAARKDAYEEEKKTLQEMYEAGTISLDEYNTRVNNALTHWLGGYAQLSDEFKAQTKENAEFAKTHFFDELDREINNLQDKYDKTGDTHYLDEQERLIKGDDKSGLGFINKQLEALYANGLDENNSEVQFWLDKQKEYNGQLEDILDERNDIIDTNLKESRESYDETYTKTGDNSVFLQEIKDIEDAQKAKLALIEEYKKLGYTEDSDVIKGLRDEIKGLGDDILDVNQKYADSIIDLADKNAEAIEKEIEKTGNVDKYYDIANIYDNARKQIGQMIADEYAKGEDANYSYIQTLQSQYDSLGEKIQDTFDSITKAITDNVDEQIENIDREIKETGDYSKIYDKIDVYKNGKESIKTQIAMRLAEGYTEESEEVKELLEQIQEYDDNILAVYTELADRIDTETQKQLDLIDREIKQTGDTSKYQIKLNVLADSKKSLEELKDALIKAGVNANSEIIKDLDSRIQALDDDIADTSRERADAQADAYAEVMSLETERLEKYKKEQDEIFDAKIKALEEQKEKLEEQNEEIERQNELQEKQKAILDAQRGVIKSLRMVYSGNGQWTVKPTDESVEALKEAENDLDETLRKQQIEAIDDLINALKDQKSTFDEAIDKQTTAIEEGVAAFEKAMTDSYKVYSKLDYEMIKSIVGKDAANEYQKNFNEYYEKNVANKDNSTTSTDNTTANKEQTTATEKQTKATNEQAKSTATLTGFLNRAGEAAEKFVDSLENIAYDNFSKQMQDEYGLGNVDLTKRPFVSGEKMRQAGYDVDKDGISTVYSSTHFVWQGDEENGKYVAVHVTPILPNGEVLSEQELDDYIYGELAGSNNILEADKKGIILKVDTDLDISEEDYKSLESGNLTKHMQDILNATDEWNIQLHNVQETWMKLWEMNFGELNTVKADDSANTSSTSNTTNTSNNTSTLDESTKNVVDKVVDLFSGEKFSGFLGIVQKFANGEMSVSSLPTSVEALSQVADGANIVEQQTINNVSNFTPNINNNFTINAPANSAEDIKNAVTGVIDDKIVQSFRAFYDGYYQQSMKEMYGN